MTAFHVSDILGMDRCAAAFKYQRAGAPQEQSSALAYGSVIHFVLLEVFERLLHQEAGLEAATKAAIESFHFYWNPLNIDNVCAPVSYWLPGQTRSGLLLRGEEDIRWYAEQVAHRQETLLATEYSFQVPVPGTWDEELGEPHTLIGTIDRLSLRQERGITMVEVSDVKSGKDYKFLRQNLQFTAYCLGTTLKEFWYGNNGQEGFGDLADELWTKTQGAPRRAWWISTKSREIMDAGWRAENDYTRFALATQQIMAMWRADMYPLSISGENCTYCQFRAVCGGTGVPDDDHGAPLLLQGSSTPTTPKRRRKRS
jgi:hypothetical protein